MHYPRAPNGSLLELIKFRFLLNCQFVFSTMRFSWPLSHFSFQFIEVQLTKYCTYLRWFDIHIHFEIRKLTSPSFLQFHVVMWLIVRLTRCRQNVASHLGRLKGRWLYKKILSSVVPTLLWQPSDDWSLRVTGDQKLTLTW